MNKTPNKVKTFFIGISLNYIHYEDKGFTGKLSEYMIFFNSRILKPILCGFINPVCHYFLSEEPHNIFARLINSTKNQTQNKSL